MNGFRQELLRLGMDCSQTSVLQSKDGITVARVHNGTESVIVKHFEKDEYRREMDNYRLLGELGVPTLRVIAQTPSMLVLEDISADSLHRLGTPQDLEDPQVARRIAQWYRQLHDRSRIHVQRYGQELYDETDFFTPENMALIREKTNSHAKPAWDLLESHFDKIAQALGSLQRTLTYNDFYYTNLMVARDGSSALMFDYNLLGKGYAYADIRNVLSSLSAEAGQAFLDEYGAYSRLEKAVDDVVDPVVSLCLACLRDEFPAWAEGLLAQLENVDKIEYLLGQL